MNRRTLLGSTMGAAMLAWGTARSAAAAPAPSNAELAQQVTDAERAFAKTMADRDHVAFVRMLAEEAVFFGPARLSRGRAQVADAWKRYFDGPTAPFSWAPESVQVLDSGGLGFSTGPVFDPAGKRTGTFSSVWRREADGTWRIVFDSGCPPCQCP